MRDKAGRCASGRVGVPPVVFRVPRNTPGRLCAWPRRETSAGCCAGRAARQAGRLPYPRHAVLSQRETAGGAHWERRHSCRRPAHAPEAHTSGKGGGWGLRRPARHLAKEWCASGAIENGDRNVAAPCVRAASSLRSTGSRDWKCADAFFYRPERLFAWRIIHSSFCGRGSAP